MKVTCKQCGTEFELTDSEISFYRSKNLELPKRCKSCRALNKQNVEQARVISSNEKVNVEKGNTIGAFLPKLLLIGLVAIIVLVSNALHPVSTNDEQSQVIGEEQTGIYVEYRFRNQDLLEEHYLKHGRDMGFSSASSYEAAASSVVQNSASLHKTEAEDGDDVYYLEETNEFVIVSTDGYIRTYFKPDDGIRYFNRQ